MAAEIRKVDIKFLSEGGIKLQIPQEVSVPRYSIVQWNIVFNDLLLFRIYPHGLIFTIYFTDETPFPWRRQFVQTSYLFYDFIQSPNPIIRLAEEVANVKGEYKYGVSVANAKNGEIIYDEDPILKVYIPKPD